LRHSPGRTQTLPQDRTSNHSRPEAGYYRAHGRLSLSVLLAILNNGCAARAAGFNFLPCLPNTPPSLFCLMPGHATQVHRASGTTSVHLPAACWPREQHYRTCHALPFAAASTTTTDYITKAIAQAWRRSGPISDRRLPLNRLYPSRTNLATPRWARRCIYAAHKQRYLPVYIAAVISKHTLHCTHAHFLCMPFSFFSHCICLHFTLPRLAQPLPAPATPCHLYLPLPRRSTPPRSRARLCLPGPASCPSSLLTAASTSHALPTTTHPLIQPHRTYTMLTCMVPL